MDRNEIINLLNEGNGVSFNEISTPKLLFDVLKYGKFKGILMNPIDECYYKIDNIQENLYQYLLEYKVKSKLHRGQKVDIYYMYSDDKNIVEEAHSKGYLKPNIPLGYILNGWDAFDEAFYNKAMYGFGIVTFPNEQ